METANARRKRKLAELCETHGLPEVASKAGKSPAYIDQILKGVLLPAKADGSRSERALGDAAARAIEQAYDLGAGWFDSPDAPSAISAEAMEWAKRYEEASDSEKARFRLLWMAARDAVHPGENWRAPGVDASQPSDAGMHNMDSGLGLLDPLSAPAPTQKPGALNKKQKP